MEYKTYTAKGGCWTCKFIGNSGKDSRGDICYCELKGCVFDPNVGCSRKIKIFKS